MSPICDSGVTGLRAYFTNMTTSRRTLLAGATAALTAPFFGTGKPVLAAGKSPPVVVELFTSQGCSSCPPAEAFLAELAERQEIIALEFHVDYWDYIGWKDPFADPRYTARQRAYNTLFGSPYTYTPQMVVDGRAHEVGSRRSAVEARIEAASMKRMMDAQKDAAPELVLSHGEGDALTIRLTGTPPESGPYHVTVVGFDSRHQTEVLRGENSGRNLVNAHVVRSMTTVGQAWSGGEAEFRIDMSEIAGDGGCAVLIQNPDTGRIAAAHRMMF